MQAKFIVKNFGPIEHAELDLRNVNVFIGPQSSGKSTLAKLYSIFNSPGTWIDREFVNNHINGFKGVNRIFLSGFKRILDEYNILSFLQPESSIEFETDIFKITFYNEHHFTVDRKFITKITLFKKLVHDKKYDDAKKMLKKFVEDFFVIKFHCYHYHLLDNLKNELNDHGHILNYNFDIEEINDEFLDIAVDRLYDLEFDLFSNKVIYIPAERILIPILRGAAYGLQLNDVAIPRHILKFASIYEKSTAHVRDLNLDFLQVGLSYKNDTGKEQIEQNSSVVLLSEAATGIQSVIPLLLPIVEYKKDHTHYSFVIEEPELNLYPKAQYKLIHFLESMRSNTSIDTTENFIYTTHSPYILSTLNTMLYAFSKSNNTDDKKNKDIGEIIAKKAWLNPESFNAYSIQDGTAIQILDRETGLIGDNAIDEISDEMSDDFDRLMDI